MKPKDWENTTERAGSFSMTARKASIRHGIRIVLTMEKRKCCISLLSNIRYWLEDFKFDGFRFDGVTSMLYFDHGLGKAFTCYDDYFNAGLDQEALSYFIMANRLIHEINPNALSIAEEMSGLPGLATPHKDGGLGFRLSYGDGCT